MGKFEEQFPSVESFFRSVVLFGRNSASYKFAMAKSLLGMVKQSESSFISLEQLAAPFSANVADHLKTADRQGTSRSSKFLEACRKYNEGKINREGLIENTERYGFMNVIDAFHIVNQGEIPVKFFEPMNKGRKKGIVLSDHLLGLSESFQFTNFDYEVEARWRLVETAWSLNLPTALLQVKYDDSLDVFYTDVNRRIDITSSRDALNGYQKGKCFYCFENISVHPNHDSLADVDHFFPHVLQSSIGA